MNRIAFFSTSSRPIKALEALSKKFEIALIVTKTDKIIGKNKEKTPNEVKKFALQNNIKLFEIEKFNLETKTSLKNDLIDSNVDLALTFDFGYIVPKDLFDIPKHNFVNIHFSLLPKYRGASAVQFAILNDEKEFGITYHLIDATLDTGDILYQSKFPLDENWNSEAAYSFLFEKSALEICEVIQKILNKEVLPMKQNHSLATYTYSKTNPKHTFIFKEDAYITDIRDERKLYREIKAFNPWPKPQINALNLLKLKQFQGLELKSPTLELSIKINNANFKNNQIEITEVTILNGKTLNVKDFVSGYFKKI